MSLWLNLGPQELGQSVEEACLMSASLSWSFHSQAIGKSLAWLCLLPGRPDVGLNIVEWETGCGG